MPTDPLSLSAVAESLRTGDRDPIEFAASICDRIEADDDAIGAFLDEPDRRGRLTSAAEARRATHSSEDDRPPLFGVPVGIKDIIHVEGFETKAGSAVPPELFAGPEATVVRALEGAGATVAGKTVTTEFAGQAPGHTRNPHDLDHTPGGSSSGSAAAVAAGMVPLALGTQTGGSVIRPAGFCGIVGFKPTIGRIPTEGVITHAESLDHVGTFTADVESAALAASVLCERWTPDAPDDRPVLGIPEGPYLQRASEPAREALDDQADRLADAGYDVRRVAAFEAFETVEKRFRDVISAEFALALEGMFEEYRSFYRAPTAEQIDSGRDVTTGALIAGRAYAEPLRERLDERMDDAGIDLWICPATPGPAPEGISDTGDMVMNFPWTYQGVPAVTVPADRIGGLPIGLQCVGRFGEDERLLAWAEGIAEAL